MIDTLVERYNKALSGFLDGTITLGELDDIFGEIREFMIKAKKEELVELSKRLRRAYVSKIKGLPAFAKELLRPFPFKDVMAEFDRMCRMGFAPCDIKRRREIAERVVSMLDPRKILEATVRSLSRYDIKTLNDIKRAAEQRKIRIEGHESCVFLEFDGKVLRIA